MKENKIAHIILSITMSQLLFSDNASIRYLNSNEKVIQTIIHVDDDAATPNKLF